MYFPRPYIAHRFANVSYMTTLTMSIDDVTLAGTDRECSLTVMKLSLTLKTEPCRYSELFAQTK